MDAVGAEDTLMNYLIKERNIYFVESPMKVRYDIKQRQGEFTLPANKKKLYVAQS